MILNRVDLPQPEGPITPRNSPGLTDNDTLSTAVTTPSGVSNRLLMLSTTRMAASGEATRPDGIVTRAMAARVSHDRARTCRVQPRYSTWRWTGARSLAGKSVAGARCTPDLRSEEHTSELQSLR